MYHSYHLGLILEDVDFYFNSVTLISVLQIRMALLYISMHIKIILNHSFCKIAFIIDYAHSVPLNQGFPTMLSIRQEINGQNLQHLSICCLQSLLYNIWAWKTSWKRAWQPTPVLLPGEPHEQRSLAVYGPQGRNESDMTEQLRTYTCNVCKGSKFEIKRNNGNDKTYFLLSENSVYSTFGFWQ